MRKCKRCQKEFDPLHTGSRFCSDVCRRGGYRMCMNCDTNFLPLHGTFKQKGGWQRFCTTACHYEFNRKQSMKDCKQCGKTFYPFQGRQAQKYCSEECAAHGLIKHRLVICPTCGKEFKRPGGKMRKYCSLSCINLGRKTLGRGCGIIMPDGSSRLRNGYVWIKKDGNWYWQHRLVMEEKLGRKLDKREQVHHINGNRQDNRPENLELWRKHQPTGVRTSDYHCAGCRCNELR